MLLPESPYYLGFFGEFNAGKSSLINALLGSDVQAVDLQPTTNAVTIIARRPEADARSRPRNTRLVPFDGVTAWLRWGVGFMDTPGSNAEDPAHARLAREASELVSCGVYLIDATKGVHASDVDRFRDLQGALTRRGCPAPIVGLGHFDRFQPESPGEEDELVDEVARHFRVERHRVFRFSAKDLSQLEGPKLQAALAAEILASRRGSMLAEVKDDKRHPLRQAVARREPWATMLDAELRSDALGQELSRWDSHCEARRRDLATGKISAFTGYIVENILADVDRVAAWRSWYAGHWSGWRAGVHFRAKLVHDGEAMISSIHSKLDVAGLAQKVSKTLPEIAEGAAGCTGCGVVILAVLGAMTGGVALLLGLVAIAGIVLLYAGAWLFVLLAGVVQLCLAVCVALLGAIIFVSDFSIRATWWALLWIVHLGAFAALFVAAPFRVATIGVRLERASSKFLEETGLDSGPPPRSSRQQLAAG